MTSTPRTIGTTMTIRAIQADGLRKSLTFFNTHATAIVYAKEGGSVGLLNGIPIYPQGSLGVSLEDDGKSVTEPWSLISDTADTRVIVFEGQ